MAEDGGQRGGEEHYKLGSAAHFRYVIRNGEILWLGRMEQRVLLQILAVWSGKDVRLFM